jgi:2',3'-cyclic-nucleotide 2'-phosphodiesterase (5'-nucleotidase family)
VLVVDAGNSLANDQDPAKASQGQTSVEAMNQMGYDAAALGALDLALGPEVLKARSSEADFSFLSANAYLRGTDERIAKPYAVKEIGGQTIYLIGLTGYANTDRIEVHDAVESLRAALQEIPAKSSIVILLSNAGEETDKEIAKRFHVIDLVVAGGGDPLRDPEQTIGATAPRFIADFVAPGHAGRNIGVAQLAFNGNGKLTNQSWQRVRLGQDVDSDPAMAEWVQQVKAEP